MDNNRKKHWDHIYETRKSDEVSWHQPTPSLSLDLIQKFKIPVTGKIIDIGGGDSLLADHLLELGYQDITVLDISENAIEKAKLRLGNKASLVKWIVSDITTFKPTETYDFWHDRATFHFLIQDEDIDKYVNVVRVATNAGAIMVIGTFSETGPLTCSGLEIRRYSESSMTETFKRFFEKISCETSVHKTPFDTYQNFIFCSFRKKKESA